MKYGTPSAKATPKKRNGNHLGIPRSKNCSGSIENPPKKPPPQTAKNTARKPVRMNCSPGTKTGSRVTMGPWEGIGRGPLALGCFLPAPSCSEPHAEQKRDCSEVSTPHWWQYNG